MTENTINTNLYSRQIGTYGLNTMVKLSRSNIYIYGQRGLGIEIAKNIILAGVKAVTIYDNKKAKINDLTANFYITEKDVEEGKRLDESSINNLSNLNPYVTLYYKKNGKIIEHLKENIIKSEEKYNVVVISEFLPKKEIIEINNFCRENEIKFIYGCAFGINTFCFVDFGNDFTIYERSSEKPKSYTIQSITKGDPGIISFVENIDKTQLRVNDYVIFKEIEGMKELNGKTIQLKKIDDNKIEIDDISKFSDYTYGGIMQKVEMPSKINFDSFERKVEEPYNESDDYPMELDAEKPNTYEILHIGLLGLCNFYEKHNSLPEINNDQHAKELIEISKEIFKQKENKEEFWIKGLKDELENFDELFENTIKHLSFWSRIEISPITSFLGGIMAQEIVKSTGKYIPIKQWLWCNFSEIIENLDESQIDRNLKGTRYDDQIAIFGNEFQKKLGNTNIFMIGAGALGCEFLKSFACMGIATDEKNKFKVTVTDNDDIIESNLNRQFLFRKEDIGKSKSKVAINSIKKINPSFNCKDYQARIGPENEKIFNDNFWKKQNFIINAVDNVEARIYTSNKSKLYNKILIDSGTTGVKANSQVIIPYKTIGYENFKDNNNSNQIPMCTLRYYPSKIEHCIEWARDIFDGSFVNIIQEIKSFLQDNKKDIIIFKTIESFASNFPNLVEYQILQDENPLTIMSKLKIPKYLKEYFLLIREKIIKKSSIPEKIFDTLYQEKINNYFMNKIYDKIYPIEPETEDSEIYRKATMLSWVEPNSIINKDYIYETSLPDIIHEFQNVNTARTPQKKFNSIQKILDLVKNLIIFNEGDKSDISLDDATPVLFYVFIKAHPYKIFTDLEFIKLFLESKIGVYSFNIKQIESAINMLMSFNETNFGLTKEEFNKRCNSVSKVQK